jgi:mannose-6-phosphate isomerase
VSDPARNYKDASHKPELIVALTPFFSLDGFRPLREIVAALEEEAPELRPLMPDIAARAARAGDDAAARAAVVKALYERAMRLPQERRNELLTPLVERLERQNAAAPFPDDTREHWVLETDRRYARGGDKDRGVLSLYLLNFVALAPGQGLFLGAGELHSYLRGVGVEVMANSDNVIRGGLTPKHVDVEALLSIVKFNDGAARVIEPDVDGVYRTPADEFEVARLHIAAGRHAQRPAERGVDIWLATVGRAEVIWSGGVVAVAAGVPVLVPVAIGGYDIRAVNDAELFRASARRA